MEIYKEISFEEAKMLIQVATLAWGSVEYSHPKNRWVGDKAWQSLDSWYAGPKPGYRYRVRLCRVSPDVGFKALTQGEDVWLNSLPLRYIRGDLLSLQNDKTYQEVSTIDALEGTWEKFPKLLVKSQSSGSLTRKIDRKVPSSRATRFSRRGTSADIG